MSNPRFRDFETGEEPPMKAFDAYRDGHVHVMERMCDTCIFRPDGLDLDPGRLASMVAQATRNNTAIICHSTLTDDNAVCFGFFANCKTPVLRLAEAMNVVAFDSAEGRHP